MTELLAKAFAEASRLPREKQDDIARHLMEDLAAGSASEEAPPARREPPKPRRTESSKVAGRRATKEDWRHKFEVLFSALGGRQEPIGAEALQKRMRRETDLGPNELSRKLIESRDE